MPAFVFDASAKTDRFYHGGIGYQSDATRSGTLFETDIGGNITLSVAIPLLMDGLVFTGNAWRLNGGIIGGQGADTMTGLAYDDVFAAGTGVAVVDGGDGIDEVSIDLSDQTAAASLFNGGAPGVVYETKIAGKYYGSLRNVEIVNVRTGAGNDVVGTALIMQAGVAYGGTFNGGGGTDTFVLDASGVDSSIELSNGPAVSEVFRLAHYDISNFERLNFTGRAGKIYGGSSQDRLIGSAANDWFDGQGGGDQISGGAGDDVLLGGRGNNIIDGGEGTDVAGFDFSDQKGNVVLVNGGVAGTTYQITSGGAAFGSVRNVEVTGSITGGAGNDRIGGVYGAATAATYSIVGGSGTDTFVFDASALKEERFFGALAGLPGTPALSSGFIYSVNNSLSIESAPDLEAIEFTGNANNGKYGLNYGFDGQTYRYGYGYGYDWSGGGISGGVGADKLTGLDGNDVFNGGCGANVIDGGGGLDVAGFDFSDQTGDVVLVNGGVPGTTYQITSGGNPYGSVRNIEVTGAITGGSGNDRIGGVYGINTGQSYFVSGGAGTDTFVFDVSELTDFNFSGGIGLFGFTSSAYAGRYTSGELITISMHDVEVLEFTGNANGGNFVPGYGYGGDPPVLGNGYGYDLTGRGVYGGAGADRLTGLDGNDLFWADRGANVVDGGGGIDFVGLDFSDQTGDVVLVNGGVANTTYPATVGGQPYGSVRNIEVLSVAGGEGNDRLGGVYPWPVDLEYGVDGGPGVDTFVFDASAQWNSFYSKDGDLYNLTGSQHVIIRSVENIEFTGNSFPTFEYMRYYWPGVVGGRGDDKLTGLDGDDVFHGGRGANVIDGGAGIDTAGFDFSDQTGDVVMVNGGVPGVTYEITVGGVPHGSVRNVEITGSIRGGPGNDRIGGVYGRPSDPANLVRLTYTVEGGDGDDTFVFDASSDTEARYGGVIGAISFDGLPTSLFDNATGRTVFVYTDALEFTGNATGSTYYDYFLGVHGGVGNDKLTGMGGGDHFRGGSGDDLLTGNGGNDWLDGGLGANVIDGGEGLDAGGFDFSDQSGDVVLVNGGVAGVAYQPTVGGLPYGSVRNVEVTGNVVGGKGNDRVGGVYNWDSDTKRSYDIFGGDGTDVFVFDASGNSDAKFATVAPSGISYLFDTRSESRVYFSPDMEAIEFTGNATAGLAVSDVGVQGGTGNDKLTGLSGDDTFTGDTGDDVLTGNGGDDRLFGGEGIDVAVFNGSFSKYALSSPEPGVMQVSGADGVDRLEAVEFAVFLEGVPGDFGGAPWRPVAVDRATVTQAEGQAGATNYVFILRRTAGFSVPQTLHWSVRGAAGENIGAATGADFVGGVLPTGSVSFPIGVTQRTITVAVQGDAAGEGAERFAVALGTTAEAAASAPSFAQGVIVDDEAELSIAALNATRDEGQSGTTAFTFMVTRSLSVAGVNSASYAVVGVGGAPANAADFVGGVLPSGVVSFSAGQASRTITVNVAADSTVEAGEGFSVTLSAPSAGTAIGTATATGTILNDDASLSIAALSASQVEGNTGTTPFTFRVTRTGDTTRPHTVNYAVSGSGGSPANAADFLGGVLPTGGVSFAAGETTRTVTLSVVGDQVGETNEAFTITLSAPSTGAVIGTASAAGSIVTDDALLSVAPLAASVAEGTGGAPAFTFTATRIGDTTVAHTAAYAVTGSGGSPANAADFLGGVLPSGSVSFAIGEASRTITVNVAGDTAVEPNEGFTLTLSAPAVFASLGTAAASGLIVNDDAALSVSAVAASQAEGNGGSVALTFTVSRSGDTTVSHVASYAVTGSGGSPADASDFVGGVLPTGTVSFAPGDISRTITVNVAGDTTVESDEWVTLTLSAPSAGATIGTAAATGTILTDDAGLSIAGLAASRAEGTGGSMALTFTVTRVGDTSRAHTASYAVAGLGTNPANAADFQGGALPAGSVSFAIGETSRAVTVMVAGDALVEPDEGFTVTLSAPSAGAAIGIASAAGTILNDDAQVSVAPLAASRAEGTGGTTPFTFTVARLGDVSVAHIVGFAVTGSGGIPAVAADFAGGALPSGTVSFAPGEASRTVTVAVAGDTAVEADEGFTLTLSAPSAGATIGTAAATGTIVNDDAALSIAALAANRREGQGGTTAFTFTVTRTGDTGRAHTASYAVAGAGGSPATAADFAGGVLPSGVVSFAAGVTSRTITVPVVGDSLVEPGESFIVTLSAASAGATIGAASAQGTILNDDADLSVGALAATAAEGTGGTAALTFTVTRSGDTAVPHTASYAVTGAGANPADAVDFAGGVLPSGIVSFGIGEASRTISVAVTGDAEVEADEGFAVALSAPSSGAIIGTATATGTIVNDDAELSIAGLAAIRAEGHGGTTLLTFMVTRVGDTTRAHTAAYSVTAAGGSPADATDFVGGVLPSGIVSFAVGETTRTITVDVAGDDVVEGNEGFAVTLSAPSAGASIVTAMATGIILNDDSVLSVAALASSAAEGNGGTTLLTFTVTRLGDTAGSQTVAYAVAGSGGTPADALDFVGGVLPAGIVSFAQGEASRTVTISVVGDSSVEADEGFTLTLSMPSAGATIATAAATGTIGNDDAALSIAALAADKAEGNVGATPLTFTVTRAGDTSRSHTAGYAVAGGWSNPADAADFAGGVVPSGIVSFGPGETSTTIAIDIAGDWMREADETFVVALATPSVGATLAPATATGTIRNDDVAPTGTVSLARLQASRAEGQAGTTPFTFLATRSGNTSGPAWADWNVTAGDATASDFAGAGLPSGRVTFAPGAANAIVTIDVAADTAAEGNEGFTATLSGVPAGVTLGQASAGGIVWNDDTPGTGSLSIRALSAQKAEGHQRMKSFTFTVTRSGNTSGSASADWSVTSGGVANTQVANGADFLGGVLPSGRVSFAAGLNQATIAVNVVGDGAVEANESFTVALAAPQAGVSIRTASATGVILNDDTVRVGGPPQSTGSEGADVFLLGAGMTNVFGGAGVDLFRFLPAAVGAASANTAILADFTPAGGEMIDLAPIDAIAATLAEEAFTFIGTAGFSAAGQVRWQDLGAYRLVQGEVTGDGIADLTLLVAAAGPVEAGWFAL